MTLDQTVIVHQRTETGGSGVASGQTWSVLSPTLFAAVDFPGGREFRALGQQAAECDAVFTVRTNTALTNKHRLIWGGRAFAIDWVEPVQRKPFQRITAKEVA